MRSPDRIERTAGWLAFFCIAVIALMFARPSFTNASRPQNGIADPVLSLQMARTVGDVDGVLSDAPSPDREVMRIKQYEDFAFIAGYAALYLAFAGLLSRKHRKLAMAGAILGLAAAAFDVGENLAILRVVDTPLGQTTQALIDAIYYRSVIKWMCGFAALGLLSIYFLKDRRRIVRFTGAVFVFAVLLGFYGLYNTAVLIAAPLSIALGLCGTAIAFLLVR
ncbi:MAG: hypothetical protein ACRD30_06050 [Bryobacteraceae bacterium]